MPSGLSALWGREKARLAHSIKKEFLAAIGEIVVYAGALEVGVDMAISVVLKMPIGAQAAMTIGIGMQYRLDMLQGLAETSVRSTPRRETLLKLIAAIRTAEADRNFIVHAHWLPTARLPSKGVLGGAIKPDGDPKFGRSPSSPRSLAISAS